MVLRTVKEVINNEFNKLNNNTKDRFKMFLLPIKAFIIQRIESNDTYKDKTIKEVKLDYGNFKNEKLRINFYKFAEKVFSIEIVIGKIIYNISNHALFRFIMRGFEHNFDDNYFDLNNWMFYKTKHYTIDVIKGEYNKNDRECEIQFRFIDTTITTFIVRFEF